MTVAEGHLTIADLLREGIRSTFSDRRGLLLYGMMPVLLLMAAGYIDGLRVVGDSSLVTLGAEAGLCALAFAWQRRYFIGPAKESWLPPWRSNDEFRHVGGLALVYALRALLLVGTIMAAVVAAGIVLYYGFQELAPAGSDFLLTVPTSNVGYQGVLRITFEGAAFLLALLLVPVFIMATARFLLVFPAYASGKRMSWLQSWRLCRGHGLRLGVAVALLAWLPPATVVALFLALPPPPIVTLENIDGFVAFLVGVALLFTGTHVLGLLVALNVTAFLYKRLTEPADLSGFD